MLLNSFFILTVLLSFPGQRQLPALYVVDGDWPLRPRPRAKPDVPRLHEVRTAVGFRGGVDQGAFGDGGEGDRQAAEVTEDDDEDDYDDDEDEDEDISV